VPAATSISWPRRFYKGVTLVSLSDTNGKGKKIFTPSATSFRSHAVPADGFLQMISSTRTDSISSTTSSITFAANFSVKCVARFRRHPLQKPARDASPGASGSRSGFQHRPFNGSYNGGGTFQLVFDFDSWRTNVQAGTLLADFRYSEEKDLHYALSKKLDFKSADAPLGYNLGTRRRNRN